MNELVDTVAEVAGKEIHKNHVEGPWASRRGTLEQREALPKIKSLGWEATTPLKEGIAETYAWIKAQAKAIGEA